MNRQNATMNHFAVDRLDVRAHDRVIEVGFGGGVNLRALLAGAAFVAGVDRSPAVVRIARRRFSKFVESGRAEFRVARVECLPYVSATFTKACTVNTVYFWRCLDRAFAEIYRVLEPGGLLVVGFRPKQWMDQMQMPADYFTARTPDEVTAALSRTGFADSRIERPTPAARWNVVVARR